MNFEELPLITESALFREAKRTRYKGKQITRKLREEGRVSPRESGRGHLDYSMKDARIVLEELAR